MRKENALVALKRILHRNPYKKGESSIYPGSNSERAGAYVVGPPNPDIDGRRRHLIITVYKNKKGEIEDKFNFLDKNII